MDMLPRPELLGNFFHELFKNTDNSKNKNEFGRRKKRKFDVYSKKKLKDVNDIIVGPPEIELPGNASEFSTFASVRQVVLEAWAKKAGQIYLASSASVPTLETAYEADSDSDATEIFHPPPLRVPKIVGIGLRSVLELIRESRTSHPALCTKALKALLDVLQGQQPEGLKDEPAEVIDPLFDLLLELATSHTPESSTPNDGNHFTAIACSCLLSLVVVRGSTGKLLAAISALLMSRQQLAGQNIYLPHVLVALQRSLHGVLLGKLTRPDWITHGIPDCSKIDSFVVNNSVVVRSVASDGRFLYFYTSRGLLKVGCGYGGTIKGHTYYHIPELFYDEKGWLGYASEWLWLKMSGKRGIELIKINRDPFHVVDTLRLDIRDWGSGVWFSDGDQLGIITPVRDDGFVVRTLNPVLKPAVISSEVSLKLARKCIDVVGSSCFDEETSLRTLNTGSEEETVYVTAGKEFSLIRTGSGKVLYSGKGNSLGLKGSGVTSRWTELIIPKSPRVTHIAVGHEGLHAVIVTDDGAAYFAGTARRGEDGDQNKPRRQPKPVKPKKIVKFESEFIIHAAANNGTTALVTRDGQLLMCGKDTVHCDSSTGHVTELQNMQITQVALGKAHAVALTSKGIVYTFGINNKGQCGRDFPTQVKEAQPLVVAMETAGPEEDRDEELEMEDGQEVMCQAGKHEWRHDLCMVCTVCRECTGYSVSCLSSQMRGHRIPGQECGCGEGDSGCANCGCCKPCAQENVDNNELALLGPSGIGDLAGMMRLDLIFGEDGQGKSGVKLTDHIQRQMDERKPAQNRKAALTHILKIKSNNKQSSSKIPVAGSSANNTMQLQVLHNNKLIDLANEEQAGGSDVERDTARVTSLPPAPVTLPYTSPVVQIDCGLHHTVVLTQSGEVYTFGSNMYGQLGVDDVLLRGGPVCVRLPSSAHSVAAGSNHTVVLTDKGEVYTFGSYQKGQLGRKSQNGEVSTSGRKNSTSRRDVPWYALPAPVPGIGPRFGRRATWVGAAGDQTFIKVDESLINSNSLEKSTVTANKNCIILVPRGGDTSNFQSLAISRRDGNCVSFSGPGHAQLVGSPICLDPLYNVLWRYSHDTRDVSCYNVIASEARSLDVSHSVFDPELTIPVTPNCLITRSQAALHLLGSLDTMALAQFYKLEVTPDVLDRQPGPTKTYTVQDFSAVNRFESHGGGWGYSGHSIEAIRFMADADIIVGGFGLFGGRGEYTAKIKLLDIGADGGEQEPDGEVVAETEDVPYECGPRQRYPMMFDEPVLLQGNRWYVAWARVSGPSSDCGSNGQVMITTEDQITFYFKSSKKSNNGTDVNAGQLPQLLYRVITQEIKAPPRPVNQSEPVYVLSREFSSTVNRECFNSLLALLQWSWNTLKLGYNDGCSTSTSQQSYTSYQEHERLVRWVFISRACLRLIHYYTNEIYPNQVCNRKPMGESVLLAECMGDVRILLRQILSDRTVIGQHKELTDSVLEECHKTFVLIFHVLYPTPFLKWTCLCDLLSKADKNLLCYSSHDRLLSAVLSALCGPTIRLRSTLPILTDTLDPSMKQLSPSDNSGLTMSGTDHHYPLLVEHMSYKTQLERNGQVFNWNWNDVLERLLELSMLPVRRELLQKPSKLSAELVKHCCHLLARVMAELVYQSNGSDEDVQGSCGRVLHTTPCRFTRLNSTRTWNTGNGSPDAICFTVDRPGVVVAGACVYGGTGVYEYELELFDDQSNSGTDPSPAQRWTSLELVKGAFSPDDCVADVAEVKFDRPVPIKENIKYALRLRNHGGRTSNGDGGVNSVKGPDGVTFTFYTCSLSFNGTTQTRGQIPHILYYSNPQDSESHPTSRAMAEQQARECTLSMTTAIIKRSSELLSLARERAEDMNVVDTLSKACFVTTLLPLVLAHIGTLATSSARSAVQVMNLIQEVLPHVSALNLLSPATPEDSPRPTSSNHYAWVESDHPYKPASVSNYRVSFPDTVKWMVIEFAPGCGTAQNEDSLQLYISANGTDSVLDRRFVEEEDVDSVPVPYWPVLRKLRGGSVWPQSGIVLPGNEVIFSLETASDYLKDEKACFYGFRCLVIGYEWSPSDRDGLKHLESELAYLGGMCAASLIKKDLQLPVNPEDAEEDVDTAREAALLIANEHPLILKRGLALSQLPTVSQALDGTLPFSCHSNERLFLRDLVQCSPGTSGGRLGRWLQPESHVDPCRCEALYSRDEMRCGWPAIVTVITKDQYGDVVHTPNLKIEVKAVPIDNKEVGNSDQGRKMRRVSQADAASLSCHVAPPPLNVPYQATIKDKMCYNAITMMKVYENYSFEELRYMSPTTKRTSENMLVRPNNDGTYSATWTPSSVGWYSVLVNIDGYPLEEVYKVEVKEPPQGVAPPAQNTVKKATHQPSKLRKFVAKNSAGLRIRAHPSLQSEQIGVVHVNGTIAFIDEIHNDDGVWLRLNHDTMRQYCSSALTGLGEAWCLQYNQHLGKTLLLPIEEPKSILDQVIKDTIARKLPDRCHKLIVPGTYSVDKCGAAGHNIRSRPSLHAPPVGTMVLGNQVRVVEQVVTDEGTWVRLDPDLVSKFCFNYEGDAWSMALSSSDAVYLKYEPAPETDSVMRPLLADAISSPPKKGYDFTTTGQQESCGFTFGSSTPPLSGSTNNPFVFGQKISQSDHHQHHTVLEKKHTDRFSSLQRLKGEDVHRTVSIAGSNTKDVPPELAGVSVKELVKAIGESRANGNGETPPSTPPRRTSRSSSPKTRGLTRASRSNSPKPSRSRSCSPAKGHDKSPSRTSSPVPIPGTLPYPVSTPPAGSPPRSYGHSPLGGALMDSQYSVASQRRGSTQSDTSALVSSLTRDLSQSPLTRDLSPSPSTSSLQMKSEGSPARKESCVDEYAGRKEDSPKKEMYLSGTSSPRAVIQTGTQTSPDASNSIKGHFSIGSGGGKEERVSPKLSRKDRSGVRGSSKRAMSPAPHLPSSSRTNVSKPNKEPVKEAMSPSVAESLRAIFAAFLWHEGIVHDAMACASFLKFHPTLPKQGAMVITRHLHTNRDNTANKEQKQLQRHSVEVSTAGNYLHIQPATLESLTRSAANANRSRRKHTKPELEPSTSAPRPGNMTVSVLPPALRALLLLWEDLTAICKKVIEHQTLLPSPSMSNKSKMAALNTNRDKVTTAVEAAAGPSKVADSKEGKKTSRKKKEWKPMGRSNVFAEVNALAVSVLGSSSSRDAVCELCGGVYPTPVTYHMRQSHPGCGGHAGGKGYNSCGTFCVGWAGHCGDGGVGGSSWYLVCDTCREKYLKSKKENNPSVVSKDKSKKSSSGRKKAVSTITAQKVISPAFSYTGSTDPHIVMKDNAMFLLNLASSAPPGILDQQRRSVVGMPSVAENFSPPETAGPFSPVGPFQCLESLGVNTRVEELQDLWQRNLPQECGSSIRTCSTSRPVSECHLSDSECDGQKGRLFHRSVSMGTSGGPWAKKEGDGRVILARRRNNSSGEVDTDGGSSLLCYPSAALQRLVPGIERLAVFSGQGRVSLDILRRPSISFMLRLYPLGPLRVAMKHALRKATCRLYAFQALNWLLRNVTQSRCLHDLLWLFVSSLSPCTTPEPAIDTEEGGKKEESETYGACEHPLSGITFAGDAATPLWKAFHQFLQTVADLMLLLPPGSALQTMAVRCYGVRFSTADHVFLHQSQVFNNISKILSRSEEEFDNVSVSLHDSQNSALSQHTCSVVEALTDITANTDIKVSSRQAMVASLTDNSTETFWESGDEDRNKTKSVTITCGGDVVPRMIYIHIDNGRDLANKVSSVVFLSGPSSEELCKIRQAEVESRSSGWISCPVLDCRHSVLRLELKGPDNSLRLRQVRVLGETGDSLAVGRQGSSVTIQQRMCEAETLKVFRLITSQVFGKLILGEEVPVSGGESNDLKEHMVGILFSRSKLSHLQKQVCIHIVQAIRKEATRVRDEWESLLCSPVQNNEVKPSDTYAFEMLSMVLALSGSNVGRTYLSHQYGLLTDLLSLLHTGSARVQRQVTALLRRVLPEVTPTTLRSVLGVEKLPPHDFSIASAGTKSDAQFNIHAMGILDVFLSIVAKALTVQVKVKGKDGKGLTMVTLATAIHPKDPAGQRWWLKGCISRKLAEGIIDLLKDMASGKISEAWESVTKGAIAENILNLTRLDETQRGPAECLRTPTLWLALASLCVLDKDHVERLSSGQWAGADGQPPPPRPTCSNHDDGETGAIIQCSVCGNLCGDCDRYLHLHRRTRMHQRQVCKEEEEAIKVDLHEGCGRTKLFWVLALADSCTLKAMVEFREGNRSKPASLGAGVCRFCGTSGNSGLLAIGNVCADHDCQEHARNACAKIQQCGHMCGGLSGETKCLPCLQGCGRDVTLKQDADDMCMICFTEALSCAPAIQLECGHVFHSHCSKNALTGRWAGPRITFSFSHCPICKSPMEHEVLRDLLKPIKDLYEDVRRKALMRLEYEGLHKAEAITSVGARFYNDPAAYAMDRYAYYVCFKCNKAYYGGLARCDSELGGEFDPSELVCGGCSDVARAQMCPKHGTDFLEYKCRYCCSVAVFFCFGTTHFCNPCHDDFQRVTNIARTELPTCPAGPKAKQLEGDECPLHLTHPPTGEEFALGCGVCRNAHTF